MTELIGAWFLLWALISMTWLVRKLACWRPTPRQPREPPPSPPPSREQQIRWVEKKYLEEVRLIESLKLEPDEQEAAREDAKEKFLWAIKGILE